eukprot:9227027-Lingulodinium_polyedra.AAC.1
MAEPYGAARFLGSHRCDIFGADSLQRCKVSEGCGPRRPLSQARTRQTVLYLKLRNAALKPCL